MQTQESKLMKQGLDPIIAAKLVDAGLTTPKMIKAASAQELEAAVGSENVAVVEQKFNISR